MGNDRGAAKITAVKQDSAGQIATRPASGRTSPLSWLISGLVFAALGVVLFAGGVIMIVRQRAFLAEARLATATIVEPSGVKSSSYKTDGPPAFEFKDGAGTSWRVDGPPSKKERDYTVGQKIDIRYPLAHPDQAVIADFDNLWSLAIFMMVISVVPISAGLWTVIIGWRGMQDAKTAG